MSGTPVDKPDFRRNPMRRRTVTLVALALLSLTMAASSPARSTDTKLSLVGYAVPREALGAVIKAWQQTPDGRDVSFTQSYGASGDQARAVAAGLKADVVQLSTGLDIDLLVKAGLVDSKWNRQSAKGIATNSIVVFAVRDGNPKKIKNWNDLLKPGVGIVTPNPQSSGAAKWNVLAAYGAQRRLGKTDKQAITWVERMFRNVVSLDTSGRNATNSFLAGRGDVFITYENEARLAKLQYVIPPQTSSSGSRSRRRRNGSSPSSASAR
jgi:sulfate transport system substrate-binding protein